METKKQKWLIITLFTFFVLTLAYVSYKAKGGLHMSLGIYGSIMVTYLIGKMLLSFQYKPETKETLDYKVSVIIPSYNEKPDAVIKTVESILEQDYPIHEVFLIDDGSKDVSGYEAVLKYKTEMESRINQTNSSGIPLPKLIVHRLEKNQGKRHAQIWAFKEATGDIIFTVDSDGYVYPDAVRELLRPFHDEEVMAVTGHINARNKDENIFTKLLDMRYDNAFRVERAAQSVTGNVLVCSGPISCYRREVIFDNLEDYGNQMFLGEAVQYGDDRCLTNYAILKGKTLYQSTARCDTDVPSTLRQFLKQQIRWNKSFFRESIIALKIGLEKPKTLIWVILELSLWLMFGFIIIIALVFKIKTFGYILLLYYLGYLTFSAYARNVFYILKSPIVFLMAPLYGLIHLGLLFPLRFYALLTLKSTGWGTR
ncbi:hyaluronan synthase [Fictibacillus halophilus]|uniref:Hyaluronan synthase n=1 Tax=Fictibacillus halophilus TaxID=1610490 RepID=A0ABV2LEH7_9BACL|nr:glycosyltransferase [Fictibacillus halophilus]